MPQKTREERLDEIITQMDADGVTVEDISTRRTEKARGPAVAAVRAGIEKILEAFDAFMPVARHIDAKNSQRLVNAKVEILRVKETL